MLLVKIALVGMFLSLVGLVMVIAIASVQRGADIDKRQAEIDELLREQQERLKK